jgi:hypothetical protein
VASPACMLPCLLCLFLLLEYYVDPLSRLRTKELDLLTLSHLRLIESLLQLLLYGYVISRLDFGTACIEADSPFVDDSVILVFDAICRTWFCRRSSLLGCLFFLPFHCFAVSEQRCLKGRHTSGTLFLDPFWHLCFTHDAYMDEDLWGGCY